MTISDTSRHGATAVIRSASSPLHLIDGKGAAMLEVTRSRDRLARFFADDLQLDQLD